MSTRGMVSWPEAVVPTRWDEQRLEPSHGRLVSDQTNLSGGRNY